jgi:prevent-host-death family protein
MSYFNEAEDLTPSGVMLTELGDSTCATLGSVLTVGLRELRQNASELVRRAEAGEEIEITVSGRPGARLVPIRPRAWRTYDEISDLFSGRPDPDWEADRDRIDQVLRDPWADA